MGRFFARSGAEAQRSMTIPWSVAGSTFATVDASGPQALQSIAVAASIDLICSIASELPVHTYRDVSMGGRQIPRQIPTPGNIQDPGENGYGLADWTYSAIGSMLYRGNLFGEEISWDTRGNPRTISLFDPDKVYPQKSGDGFDWYVNGRKFTPKEEFFHARAYPQAGVLLGASPIQRHAREIGKGIAATRFGAQWFEEAADPSGILRNTETDIDSVKAQSYKARWEAARRGNRGVAVLGRGWEFKPLSVTPNESQFLETERYTQAQCARIFGPGIAETLGYETGGSMTYANVVDRREDLLALTVGKWITRVERILTGLLPAPQYVRFDRDALLRSSTKARYEAHKLAMDAGWKVANEVRDDEDLPPVEWGDERPGAKPQTPIGGQNA